MRTLLFGSIDSDDTPITIPLSDSFKVEGEWLKLKRQEIIDKDKNGANRMLINNPNRPLTLQKPTVLV